MLKFKKVVERGNGTANLNEDQKNMNKKLLNLKKHAENLILNLKKFWIHLKNGKRSLMTVSMIK